MYDYNELSKFIPELSSYLKEGKLDYSSLEAVRLLNRALLLKEYKLNVLLPEGHLCPTIPNRTEYIRQIESILKNIFRVKEDAQVVGIDIGTGVSCVYPLIGCARNLNWKFFATDIDDEIISISRNNVELNRSIVNDRIKIIKNDNATCIFPESLISCLSTYESQKFVMSNPPFYTDTTDLESRRSFKRHKPVTGKWEMRESELGTELGGETGFTKKMIIESIELKNHNIQFFSCMLGMKESLDQLLIFLSDLGSIKSYSYDFLQINHTCRYLLFWSFSREFPKDSNNKLKRNYRIQTIPIIDLNFNLNNYVNALKTKYGSIEDGLNESRSIRLTHNKWSRKFRRSPSSAPSLPSPIEITIEYENNLLKFCPDDEADWEVFLGFVNHLRKEKNL